MICELEVSEEQLRSALAVIEKAKGNGFVATTAIFRLHSGMHKGDIEGVFINAVVLKAHPTDPNKNWGRTYTRWVGDYAYKDGACGEIEGFEDE